jgi:hypothetical protein
MTKKKLLHLTKEELFHLGGDTDAVDLTRDMSNIWWTFGQKLGVKEEVMRSIHSSCESDKQRLGKVWTEWFEHADQLEYPVSWRGLHQLLLDNGQGPYAKGFFEFMDKL